MKNRVESLDLRKCQNSLIKSLCSYMHNDLSETTLQSHISYRKKGIKILTAENWPFAASTEQKLSWSRTATIETLCAEGAVHIISATSRDILGPQFRPIRKLTQNMKQHFILTLKPPHTIQSDCNMISEKNSSLH